MKIVHLSDSLNRAMGGPPRSIVALCEHLAPLSDRVDLCCVDLGSDFGPPVEVDTSRVNLTQVPARLWKSLRLYVPRGLGRILADTAASAGIIHSHGLWAPANVIAARVARKTGVPHIISPRGSLAPEALAKSAWKKAIFRRLFVDRALRRAACLHALTDREASHIRQFGLTNPIAVIPNGVAIEKKGSGTFFEKKGSRPAKKVPDPFFGGGKRFVVFLGRMHPIKGLDNLIEAWRRIEGRFAEWQLVLAGPDEQDYLAVLESQVARASVSHRVSFPGGVYGDDKQKLLSNAGLFVLPSRSEGMSVALLEAMSAGLPAVITLACNFPSLADAGGGLVVDGGPDSLADALTKMLEMPEDRRREMGARAAMLVREKYSWDILARRMLEVYEWILGGRDRPECVRLD